MEQPINDWVEQIKARGLDGAVLTALDLLTPLGTIVAQLLHVVHPASRLVNWQDHIAQLADLLENPEAIDALKRRLEQKD
jgi:hypothetical protein